MSRSWADTYTALTPELQLLRLVYRKGLKSGRDAKVYQDASREKAYERFQAKYGSITKLNDAWMEGWHDAAIYRVDQAGWPG